MEIIKDNPSNKDLYYARVHSNLSADQAAAFLGVHRTTYKRQEIGDSKVCKAAYISLMMLAGFLPGSFSGWRIINGKLYSPENVGHTPGEIRATEFRRKQIFELEREIRVLQRQLNPEPEKTPDTANYAASGDNIVQVDFNNNKESQS